MNSSASKGLSVAGHVGSLFCICTTIFQFSLWLGEGMDSTTRNVFVFGVSTCLFLSQVIIGLMAQAKKGNQPMWVFAVGLLFVTITEISSISISQLSFNGNMISSARQQTSNSEEANLIRGNVGRIARQLDVLEKQYANTASDQPTNRGQISREIEAVTKRLQNEQRSLRNVSSGAGEQAISELPFGLSLAGLSFAMGIVLSGLPISNSILQGAMAYGGSPGRPSPRPTSSGPADTIRKKARAAMEA